MFDTVKLFTKPVFINDTSLEQYKPKSFTYVQKDTGALITRYIIHDVKIPYIEYHDATKALSIQLSIPKFLYGNNVDLMMESDISLFFNSLQGRINELFSIHISHEDWIAQRIDVCWNFQVEERVGDYLQTFSKQKLPYKHTFNYNSNQTVGFRNKSNRIIFYDKEKECIRNKESLDVIQRASGILRFEYEAKYSTLRKFIASRQAIKLLSRPFFDHIISDTLPKLDYPVNSEDIDHQWLINNKSMISQIETYLGFEYLRKSIDEPTLRHIYTDSTYKSRKRLAKKMTIPRRNCLIPLSIDLKSHQESRSCYADDSDIK